MPELAVSISPSTHPRSTELGLCHVLVKRLFDILIATIMLIVLSPLLALAALAVRISMGRPVFYRQKRPGYRAEPFELLKFRTMRDDIGADGEPLPDADRLTATGRFLRRTSLDELPQLLNVLRGEMSLVGPRPLLMEYLDRYSPEQARRHDVKPGITGLAQVSGRNLIDWDQKFSLDVLYVEHCSLWLDLRILAVTAVKVLRLRGITKPGHATMPTFSGTQTRDH